MMEILGGVARFQGDVFPQHQALLESLVRDGQRPSALMIGCADSRVAPELITQAGPGELFVCRNAGNIVPPFSQKNGGVSSAVEYAVVALGVRDIVICGHSDCGAMKAFFNPEALDTMPNVKAWLSHAEPAYEVVKTCYGHLEDKDKVRALSLENIAMQLTHLQNHPSVAAGLAAGKLSLHGWFFEIETGRILALDGETDKFRAIESDVPIPIAVPARERRVADPLREVA